LALAPAPVLECGNQFGACLENLLCVGQRDATGFGQRKNSPLSDEKRLTELILELPNLH